MGLMAATPRFLTLADVAEVLNTSSAQVYALVRRGDLPAIKIGGRGQWRVESARLEEYIAAMYRQAEDFVAAHPFTEPASDASDAPGGMGGADAADPAQVPPAL